MAEIPEKTKSHPYKFHKLVLQKHEIPRQESKISSTNLFILRILIVFPLTNPWTFHILLLNTPGDWMPLNSIVCFFWNNAMNGTK